MITGLVPQGPKLGEGFSRRAQAEAMFHPGRRTDGTQSAATWLTDLADLRKFINLCGFCARRFDMKAHRYRRFYVPDPVGITNGYATSGQCDGCKSRLTANGVGFIAEETYHLTCVDPVDERRQARLRARTAWAGVAIQRRAGRRALVATAGRPR